MIEYPHRRIGVVIHYEYLRWLFFWWEGLQKGFEEVVDSWLVVFHWQDDKSFGATECLSSVGARAELSRNVMGATPVVSFATCLVGEKQNSYGLFVFEDVQARISVYGLSGHPDIAPLLQQTCLVYGIRAPNC